MAGPSIANQTPAEVFTNLLLAGDNGQGISTTPLQLQDGIGNQAPMYIATNAINFDRVQGQFQLDGVALTASANTLNNLSNFANAQYVVMAPNVELPSAFQLLSTNGIDLNTGAGTVTIRPTPGSELAGIQALGTTGIMVRDAAGTYTTVDLATNATLLLSNASGVGGNPTLSVINDTNLQRINVQNNGVFQSQKSQINFIPGANTGITVQDNPGQNRTDVFIEASAINTFFVKASCQAATTANLNAVYNNGASGVGATLTNNGALAAFAVDGYNANLNDRILVKNQTTTAENGIYDVTTIGSGAAAWVLTRASDFNSSSTIQAGDFTNIINGTVNTNTAWLEVDNVNTVGTDPIVWEQFGFGGSVTSVSGTAGQIDVVNGTTTPVISIDPAYIGQASITTLGTITTGTWHGSIIDLSHGGTNANLVASNGGIVYSNATQMQVLAGTATANQIILSGSNAAPSWSTATYPATVNANDALYANGANTITHGTLPVPSGGTGNTTFTAYSVICAGTTATGVFQNVVGVGTAGQVLTSNGAAALPTWNTPSEGTIVNQNTNTVTMAAGSQYFINNGATLVTLTLPALAAQGDAFTIIGSSAGGWTIAQQAGQTININSSASTTGVGGSVSSTNQYNCIVLRCVVANTTFVVSYGSGSFTVV